MTGESVNHLAITLGDDSSPICAAGFAAVGSARSVVRYRIVVRGAVSARLAKTIECVHASDQETVLTADVVDQAQLHGILERLRDLGIELVRIESLSAADSTG